VLNRYSERAASAFTQRNKSIGLSQSQLARELDLYVRTISKYETGELAISKVTELALRYVAEQVRKKVRR
jgi:transcriptional regulator with XRE-family HTH domain